MCATHMNIYRYICACVYMYMYTYSSMHMHTHTHTSLVFMAHYKISANGVGESDGNQKLRCIRHPALIPLSLLSTQHEPSTWPSPNYNAFGVLGLGSSS